MTTYSLLLSMLFMIVLTICTTLLTSHIQPVHSLVPVALSEQERRKHSIFLSTTKSRALAGFHSSSNHFRYFLHRHQKLSALNSQNENNSFVPDTLKNRNKYSSTSTSPAQQSATTKNQQSQSFRSIDFPPTIFDEQQQNGDQQHTLLGEINDKLQSFFDLDFRPNARTFFLKQTRILTDRSYSQNEPFENDGITAKPSFDDMIPPPSKSSTTYWISFAFRLSVILGSFFAFPYIMDIFENIITIEPEKLDKLTANFVPGIAVLYGTFTSLSLSILYERQKDIQDSVNQETSILSSVSQMLMTVFKRDRNRAIRAGQCIADQIRILVKESRGRELMCIIYSDPYARVVELLDEAEEEVFEGNTDLSVHSDLISSIRDSVNDMREKRTARLSAEAQVLPPTHFVIMFNLTILTLLGVTTETLSAEASSYYESAALFSILTGTYSLFYNFSKDLNNPFRGVYQIRRSTAVSNLLQTKFFLVNHPVVKGEIDFEAASSAEVGGERLWTPGVGEVPLD